MSSTTALATFAVGAGIATFFSPCVYALLPGYISYYVATVDAETAPLSGALSRGLAASVGALGTFALLSILAVGATSLLQAVVPLLERVIGVGLIAFGLLLVWKGRLSFQVMLPERRSSVLGFGIFGAVYALASTACVLPLFLSLALVSFELSLAGTALVLGAYAASFAVLLVSATVFTAVGQGAAFDRFAPHAGTVTRVAGIVIVIAGIVQLYVALWVGRIDSLPF